MKKSAGPLKKLGTNSFKKITIILKQYIMKDSSTLHVNKAPPKTRHCLNDPSKVSPLDLSFATPPPPLFSLSHPLLSRPEISSITNMSALFFITLSIFSSLVPLSFANNVHSSNPCRSYCGNITIDYPFALQYGCGHPGFRDLLFCMNDVLMFHISSGSYRVLEIDYAYQSVTLHEPHLSTCDTLVLGGKGNGFAVEQWRSPYFNPTADNVFMLIGCSAQSSLFQGFPGKHLPCRNVSGMGCEEYYGCQAWSLAGRGQMGSMFGPGPPECCAVAFEAIKAINLSKLGCEGYSSAYSLAPLRVDGPSEWSYGIRVKYSVQGNEEFCRACEATGGTCGYGSDGIRQLCMCGNMNSTSNCDSATSATSRRRGHGLVTLAAIFFCKLAWI